MGQFVGDQRDERPVAGRITSGWRTSAWGSPSRRTGSSAAGRGCHTGPSDRGRIDASVASTIFSVSANSRAALSTIDRLGPDARPRPEGAERQVADGQRDQIGRDRLVHREPKDGRVVAGRESDRRHHRGRGPTGRGSSPHRSPGRPASPGVGIQVRAWIACDCVNRKWVASRPPSAPGRATGGPRPSGRRPVFGSGRTSRPRRASGDRSTPTAEDRVFPASGRRPSAAVQVGPPAHRHLLDGQSLGVEDQPGVGQARHPLDSPGRPKPRSSLRSKSTVRSSPTWRTRTSSGLRERVDVAIRIRIGAATIADLPASQGRRSTSVISIRPTTIRSFPIAIPAPFASPTVHPDPTRTT